MYIYIYIVCMYVYIYIYIYILYVCIYIYIYLRPSQFDLAIHKLVTPYIHGDPWWSIDVLNGSASAEVWCDWNAAQRAWSTHTGPLVGGANGMCGISGGWEWFRMFLDIWSDNGRVTRCCSSSCLTEPEPSEASEVENWPFSLDDPTVQLVAR